MWQIRLYDRKSFWDKNYDAMGLIKEVEQEPNHDALLKINGKTYRWCAVNPENKIMGVEEITFNPETDEEPYGDFQCPYCGEVDHDAWEYSNDSGVVDCSTCGSEIEYERDVEVTYTVQPVKATEIIEI